MTIFSHYHFFFLLLLLLLGTCLDFVSQKAMWRAPAVALNFLPQNLHWTLSPSGPPSTACFYSLVSYSPFPHFSPALSAKLWAFHLGIFPSFSGSFLAGGCFPCFLDEIYGGLLKPSTSGARLAAESNAFLFD